MKRLLLALVLGIAVTASAVDLNEVDDLKPLAMRVYGVRKAVAESDTIVRIVLGASFVDARREKEAYRIISPDDPALRKAVVGAIAKQADMFIRNCDQLAFKFLKHPYSPVTWGSGAYENFAVPVAFMWRLTGDSKYRDWLIRTCDNTLGANPMGISWIVGLGERTVRCPLHNSRYRPDGVAVSGLQVQGPMQRGSGYCFTETCYPWFKDGIAKMHVFADVHFCIAMDEPTANNMANTMMIFGILCK